MATLTNMAYLFRDMQRYEEALAAFEQSVGLARAVHDPAGEVAGLVGIAGLLYQHLSRPQEAMTPMEQAIAVLQATGLPQDAAGQTVEDLQRLLQIMRTGKPLGGPRRIGVSEEIMEAVREFVNAEDWDASRQVVEAKQALLFQAEVEALFEQNIEQAKANGEEQAVRLLEQHLAVLRACKQHGIAQTFEQLTAPQEEALPFDAELISRSIAALLGGPQEKMAHAQYLVTLSASTTDEALKALINTIQLALFGSDLSPLGQNLSGVYRQAWEAIVVGVEAEGVGRLGRQRVAPSSTFLSARLRTVHDRFRVTRLSGGNPAPVQHTHIPCASPCKVVHLDCFALCVAFPRSLVRHDSHDYSQSSVAIGSHP